MDQEIDAAAEMDFRLSFVGYRKADVGRAVELLMRRSGRHGVEVTKGPIDTDWRRVRGHPKLWGCGSDATTKVLHARGRIDDMKGLIRTDTPDGVLIELLPHAR